MSKRISLLLGIAIALSLVAPVASEAKPKAVSEEGNQEKVESELFSVSGTFSGTLVDEITLNGETYVLAPDASIYEITKGLVPLGMSVNERAVFLSGRVMGDSRVVSVIIVRPMVESNLLGTDPSTQIHVLDDNAPR